MNLPEQPTAHIGMPSGAGPVQSPISSRKRFRITPGQSILVVVAFLFGVVVALLGVTSYVLYFAADTHPISTPPPSSKGAIFGQASAAFVTAIIQKNISTAGLPGEPGNVRVVFMHDSPMTVTSDVHISILGIGTTRQLTLKLQPFISACQVRMHVLHVDLQGFPLTLFAQTFEEKINQQMQINVSGLPTGFTYCAIDVHTEPAGLFLTYSALAV